MRSLRNLVIVMVAASALAACATDSANPPGANPPGANPAGDSSAAAPSSQQPSVTSAPPVPAAATCEATFLSSLTLEQKAAQLLMVGIRDAADARAAVQNYGVGGIFVGSWTDPAIFTGGALAAVSDAAPIPLMVSVDEEGGRVSRVPGANLVSARELAATMTVDQARAEGQRVGALMAGMGITVDFAPGADVSGQPDGAVIGDRSFSDDPEVVTAYATAFAAGLRAAGVYPVYKHFPGHGKSSGDSHLGGVSVPPLDTLLTNDLVPFRAAATERAGVMVGHLTVPGLTEPGTPTSLSPATMRLLREGSGYGAAPFDGVIFTDDLSGMRAITDNYTVPQAVSKALEAGADVALWTSTDQLGAAIDAVTTAVQTNLLPPSQLDDSVLRVARAKNAISC